MSFILYHTLGCHLCELAEEQIAAYNQVASVPIKFVKVDIAQDETLMELYGVRIPVLGCAGTEETLGWPFDAQEIAVFLKKLTV
jgi:thiol-disulfide isomerase/thioredoxin